ncbi:MAG: hypothetical protein L6R40_003053 [Gallowayella cf. fulva]|nr:MAG: hypothetical protein L6R40_003053 [Xanthomendoza cf. fulva]
MDGEDPNNGHSYRRHMLLGYPDDSTLKLSGLRCSPPSNPLPQRETTAHLPLPMGCGGTSGEVATMHDIPVSPFLVTRAIVIGFCPPL